MLDSRGSGPDVVLIHGLPQDPAELIPLADFLASTHRVHRVTLPGYGGTPAGVTDPIQIARALGGALRTVGVVRPVLVGVSVGFWRSAQLAEEWGPVGGLVGLGPVGELGPEERALYAGTASAIEAGTDLGDIAVARFLSPVFAAAHPEIAARVAAYPGAAPAAVVAAELRAFAEAPPARIEGHRVALRVGAADVAAPPAQVAALAARCPDAELRITPGRGHLLLIEDLEATCAWVAGVLAGWA